MNNKNLNNLYKTKNKLIYKLIKNKLKVLKDLIILMLINFHIKRGIVSISSIDAAFNLEDNYSYIKLNRFSSKSYDEFMTAILLPIFEILEPKDK